MDTPTAAMPSPAPAPRPLTSSTALTWTRMFCPEGTDVWDTVTWERRDSSIVDASGHAVFEQRDVEVPTSWSVTATNVVVSKYFLRHSGGRRGLPR